MMALKKFEEIKDCLALTREREHSWGWRSMRTARAAAHSNLDAQISAGHFCNNRHHSVQYLYQFFYHVTTRSFCRQASIEPVFKSSMIFRWWWLKQAFFAKSSQSLKYVLLNMSHSCMKRWTIVSPLSEILWWFSCPKPNGLTEPMLLSTLTSDDFCSDKYWRRVQRPVLRLSRKIGSSCCTPLSTSWLGANPLSFACPYSL